MFSGESARVAEIERDDQRIPVTQRVGRTEIVARDEHVVASGEVGIDTQVHDREARICIDDDAAVLFPPSRLLHACRIARPREDVATPNPDPQAPNQYTLKYRSSSHSLTFPMYSCHSPHFASTNRS